MSDAETIQARREAWLAAFAEADIPTMSDLTTEDHVAMPPNQPQRIGLQAVQEDWRKGFSMAKTVFRTRAHDLTVGGDVAVDRFSWDMSVTPHGASETLEDTGVCVWVWRRDGEGVWRVAAAIWNSDLPEPVSRPAGSP